MRQTLSSTICILTHAPRAGCDLGLQTVFPKIFRKCFNSRTPYGVRPGAGAAVGPCLDFNSRTPCGVRPGGPREGAGIGEISTHVPLAGYDVCADLSETAPACYFNSRTLRGVRRAPTAYDFLMAEFQLTYPLRGTTACVPFQCTLLRFQLTYPTQGTMPWHSQHVCYCALFTSCTP